MISIYSKIELGRLLHVLIRKKDLRDCNSRRDFIAPIYNLQLAGIKIPIGHKFQPHYHIENRREIEVTHEAWIVMNGKIKVFYYDINQRLIKTYILNHGDVTITLDKGGHTYENVGKIPALVYEFKVGNYLKGPDGDKIRL